MVPLPIFIHLCCKFKAKSKEELTFGKVVFYVITAFIHIFAFVNERKKGPGPPRPPQIPYLLVSHKYPEFSKLREHITFIFFTINTGYIF
jgi:hypothetical protein